MSANLAIGVKVGFSAGAALAGLSSLNKSLKNLNREQEKISHRHKMLGNLLANPLRMSKERVGELKREYTALGVAMDRIRQKQIQLNNVALKRHNLATERQDLGSKVTSTLALGASAVVPVKMAMDFETAMADVRSKVDFESAEQFKEMNNEILTLTRYIPLAGVELAKMAANGGQLGISRKHIVGFTSNVAKMSVALDVASDIASDSMAKLSNIYQIPIDSIGKLGDAVNYLSNTSTAKATDIIDTLGRVGGVTKQFNMTELQASSLATAFIDLGREPAVAATAINGMLTQLMTADQQSKKYKKTLDSIGVSSSDLKKAIAKDGEAALIGFLKQIKKIPQENQMGILVKLFGREYADDISVLVGNLEKYESTIDKLNKKDANGKPVFEGSMEKEYQSRINTTASNWTLFKNSLTEIGIVVGSAVLPAINELLNEVKPVVYAISDWAKANPKLTKSFTGFLVGLAGFKVASLGMLFGLNLLKTSLLFFPSTIAKVSAAWLGLILKFKSGNGLIFKSLGIVRHSARLFSSAFQAGLPLFKAFVKGLSGGFIGIAKVGMLAIKGLASFLMTNPIFLAFGLLATAAYLLYSRWDSVVGGAKALWQDLGTIVSGIANSIGIFFKQSWENIKSFFTSGIGNISMTIVNWSPLGLFYQTFAAVMNLFGVELPLKFTDFGKMLIDGLINGITSKVGVALEVMRGFAKKVQLGFTNPNEIKSPSRVFMKYGGFLTSGLNIGLERGQRQPVNSIRNIAKKIKSKFIDGVSSSSKTATLYSKFSEIRDYAERKSRNTADNAAQSGVTIYFNPTYNINSATFNHEEAAKLTMRDFEKFMKRYYEDVLRRSY